LKRKKIEKKKIEKKSFKEKKNNKEELCGFGRLKEKKKGKRKKKIFVD